MNKHRRFRVSFTEQLEPRQLMAVDLGDVLLLGDSITHGDRLTDSYRYSLWKDFIDADVDFNFVGSQDSFRKSTRVAPDYMGQTFPNIHEGHWGWAAESIINGKSTTAPEEGKLSDWVQTYDADLALIHLGTNDLKAQNNNNNKVEVTADYMEQIVTLLQADNPNVTIIIAQIIPYHNGEPNSELYTVEELAEINGRINDFNGVMASEAPGWATASSRVYVVNQHDDPNSPGDPLPVSYYFDFVHLDNDEGSPLMADRWFDAIEAIPPTVVDVRVSSTSWDDQTFIPGIDPDLELGYRIPNGSGQTAALPWANIDQIHLTFEEAVTIDHSDVSLVGEMNGIYPLAAGSVTFDDSNNTATVSLPSELPRDRLTLTVFNSVVDLTGNALDGDWTDEQSLFRSGNGSAGGNFVFSFNVLPGDVNQSLFVDGEDVRAARDNRFETVGSQNYEFLVDVNGDGIISGPDISIIRNRRFTDLFPPALAVDNVFADAQVAQFGGLIGRLEADSIFADKFNSRGKNAKFGIARRTSSYLA
jgi:lysophospholipase L1-like esterase